jgi:TRAP-type C4-dicarboxylate transport system permease small subunit
MLFMCWLMFKGSLDQTRINWDTEAAATGLSQGLLYGIGMVFAVSAGVMLLQDFYKLLSGQTKDEDLINIRESEEEAITFEGQGQTAQGATK